MCDMARRLGEINPGLRLYSVLDGEFAPYGRVLPAGEAALSAMEAGMARTPIPERGNAYVAHDPALLDERTAAYLARAAFGGMAMQAGYCNGRGFQLNALEYHKCAEVNFSTTGCVLLMALPGDLTDGRMDAASVVGFYLPPRVCVEVHPLVLHFAPCRVHEGGFNCMVALEMGVNSPLAHVDTAAPGEEKLLWMRGKWLTAHADSIPAAKGAFVGISGENIALNI